MAKPINIAEAKAQLSSLVLRASRGEEVVICRSGKPVAKLVPITAKTPTRVPGRWKGKGSIAEDFDAELPDHVLAGFTGDE